MTIHTSRQSVVLGAVLAAIALFGLGFFVALGVRSVVAGPDPAPVASPPNPGHSWSEIGDLPGTIWHSNNDGDGSGLDADTVDGQHVSEVGGISSCWDVYYPIVTGKTGDIACAEGGGYCVSAWDGSNVIVCSQTSLNGWARCCK